jgi:hypothetical protein
MHRRQSVLHAERDQRGEARGEPESGQAALGQAAFSDPARDAASKQRELDRFAPLSHP